MLQEFNKNNQDMMRELLDDVHTAMPGIITEVNPDEGTVAVQPALMFRKRDGDKIDFPEIFNVPIVFPQGNNQGTSVVFPVSEGDSCLLIISEQSLEYWQYEMDTDTHLKFDISNAICIPGLSAVAPSSFEKACSENAVVITAGGTSLAVAPGGVTIEGNLKVTGTVIGNGVSLSGHKHSTPSGESGGPH